MTAGFRGVPGFSLYFIFSVNVHKERLFKVQNLITMRLMKRPKDSMVTVPVDKQITSSDTQYQFDDKLSSSVRFCLVYLFFIVQEREHFVKAF